MGKREWPSTLERKINAGEATREKKVKQHCILKPQAKWGDG